MTLVAHLLRHDLREHRPLWVAWILLLVGHACLTVGPWAPLAAPPILLLLVAARLVLGVVLIGTLVHADSPGDERSFWRTRPIPPRDMAMAKLSGAALLVASGALVVLGIAVWMELPAAHVPPALGQVVLLDAAAAGLALVAATRTRTTASLLVAVVATMLGAMLVLAGTEAIARRLAGPRPYGLDPAYAFPTMLIITTPLLWGLAWLGFWSHRRRNVAWSVAGVGAILVLAVWMVPAVRLHQRPIEPARTPTVTLAAGGVHAEALPSGRVALVADGRIGGLGRGERARWYLRTGRLESGGTEDPAREPGDPQFRERRNDREPILLAVVEGATHARLVGRPARVTAVGAVEIARTDRLGVLPLRVGASVDLPGARATVRSVAQPGTTWGTSQSPLAEVDVRWTRPWSGPATVDRLIWQWRRGDVRDSAISWRLDPRDFQLPSLAQPFGRYRVRLASLSAVDARPGRAGAIEFEVSPRPSITENVPLAVDFVVPAVSRGPLRD